MGEKLKQLSQMALGFVIILALLCIPVFFILGSKWAAEHLLQPLIAIGWFLLAIEILILIPLSIFRWFRSFTGSTIFIFSFVFGLITWLVSFVLTYYLWGAWAVIAGILFLGGAVVPFALLATLFKGMWLPFFTVLILLLVTFGSRILGIFIEEKS